MAIPVQDAPIDPKVMPLYQKAADEGRFFLDLNGYWESHQFLATAKPGTDYRSPRAYSESQFKTLKYRPGFPDRFGSIQDARAFCQPFFRWYNDEHHHSAIALLTPAMLHYGRAEEVIQRRQEVLQDAYARNPERFVRACPKSQPPPTAAWINPPVLTTASEGNAHSFMPTGVSKSLTSSADRNESSDDRPRNALKIPARQGGICALTKIVASPFHAEPRQPVLKPTSEESRH